MYICVYAYAGNRHSFIFIKILQVLAYVYRHVFNRGEKKYTDQIILGWVGSTSAMMNFLKPCDPNAM